MLLRFGVENFRSVRDYQEIVLTASRRLKRSGPVFAVPVVGEDAVPVVACYGANAAGKSNLIAAVASMRDHIVWSHKGRDSTDAVPRQPFQLDRGSVDTPSRFDCTLVDGKREEGVLIDEEKVTHLCAERASVYEYGFEFNEREYCREWLHRKVRTQRRTNQLLFERRTVDGETDIRFGSHLSGENRAIAALTRPNSLFLAAAAQNNHAHLSAIHRQFAKQWTVLGGETSEFRLAEMLDETEHQEALIALIQQADLGIVGVDVVDEDDELDVDVKENSPNTVEGEILVLAKRLRELTRSLVGETQRLKRVRFAHAGSGLHAFDYDLESRGTQRLAALAMPALAALASGALVVVDELDASLHPRLTAALVKLFKGPSNRSGAQLLCTLHDTSVLKALEADEVWMAEKDRSGATSFTPLTDYRLRSRDDLEQVYRDGRVGGAAVIGDLAVGLDQ